MNIENMGRAIELNGEVSVLTEAIDAHKKAVSASVRYTLYIDGREFVSNAYTVDDETMADILAGFERRLDEAKNEIETL